MKDGLRITIVMFLWAICFPFIMIGIAYAPHLTFATLRAVLSGLALLALAFYLGRPMPRGTKNWVALIIIGCGATTFAFFGMFHASEFVSPGIATVIANTQPLMAALLAHWFIGERLNLRGQLGLAVAFLGIILISIPQIATEGRGTFIVGVSYIVVSALGITISNVAIKKFSAKFDPFMAMGWQLLIGAVPLGIMAITTEDPENIRWTGQFLFSLIGLSLFGTSLAYWLWCKVLTTVELSRANAFTFLVPLFGLAIGVSFYGERIAPIAFGGVGLTLVGIYMVTKGMEPK